MSLGRPRPIETLSVFPEGFNRGKSESPDAVKLRVRVPPPPQPSFFTATVMLQQSNELLQRWMDTNIDGFSSQLNTTSSAFVSLTVFNIAQN